MTPRAWMICWVLLASGAGTLPAVEPPTAMLDPNLPYQAERSNSVTYDVDFSVVVTPPYKTKLLRVWLPIPPSDAAQEVTASRLSTFPLAVEPQLNTEHEYGNRFAYFEFRDPQGAQQIRHQFQVRTWELRWHLDASKVVAPATWPRAFDPYRKGDSQSVIVDARFEKLLGEIVPQPTRSVGDFQQVMNWVQQNFAYDHVEASLQAKSEHALLKRRGHCSDYHGFCAAIGRVLGYPTRVTYGINTFPKNSPSHCKLEAFLPPYGWVSFDVSETQKMISDLKKADLAPTEREQLMAAAQRRLLGGFRDNMWYLQTRGTDYQLAPPASRRVPVVRTAYIEADGMPLEDPDPANKEQRAYSWMTLHDYRSDKPVKYPFTDIQSLRNEQGN